MQNTYSSISERLTSYRKRLSMTQNQMAEKMGVTQSHYSKLEAGRITLSFHNLKCFEENGEDVYYLITGQHIVRGKTEEYLAKCKTTYGKNKLFQVMLWAAEIGCDLSGNGTSLSEHTVKSAKLVQSYSDKLTIWENIRKAESVSQMKMAEIFDINIKRYRKIEKGTSSADAEILHSLYEKMSYSPLLILDQNLYYIDELNHIWSQFPAEVMEKIDSLMEEIIRLINEAEERRSK